MLVNVENLTITLDTFNGQISPVQKVSFALEAGKVLGIVGESGSGKSLTASALMGLLPLGKSSIRVDSLAIDGLECRHFKEKDWQPLRGSKVAMVFQDPMTSLNPILSIGNQIKESLRLNPAASGSDEEVIELLTQVGIADPTRRIKQYPHELSGGMRQRVVIAMALAGSPKLLIADEPTTALDVTTEAQILKLLQKLCQERNMGMIFISHNLRVIAQMCDQVIVMYGGHKVEEGSSKAIFTEPRHPYTMGLLNSLPQGKKKGELIAIGGQPPDVYHLPQGCVFHPRCSRAMQICAKEEPKLLSCGNGQVACWDIVKEGLK